MKNCRNCKHAGWSRSEKGRKLYNNWAPCNAVIDTSQMPASAWEAVRVLERGRRPVVHRDDEINCPRWEKEIKPCTSIS
jgi:hypothetical protein